LYRSDERSGARQYNANLGEFTRLSVNLDRSGMLLDNDVVTNRETKPGAFTSRLGCEERVEYFLFDVGRDARAVIPYPDFHPIAEAFLSGDLALSSFTASD
jgi:hypothetical protein